MGRHLSTFLNTTYDQFRSKDFMSFQHNSSVSHIFVRFVNFRRFEFMHTPIIVIVHRSRLGIVFPYMYNVNIYIYIYIHMFSSYSILQILSHLYKKKTNWERG